MIYEIIKYVFNFQQLQAIRPFDDTIFDGKITQDKTNKKQRNLLSTILEFNSRARPKSKTDKKKNRDTY